MLTALLAVAFLLAIGWLSEAIFRAEQEIDRLFYTTIASAEVHYDPFGFVERRPLRDAIRQHTVEQISQLEFTQNIFTETFHGDLLGFNCIEIFTVKNSRNLFDDIPGAGRILPNGAPIADFEITYVDHFSAADFVFTQNAPIPVIVPSSNPDISSLNFNAVVIGVHNENIERVPFQDSILLPDAALAYLHSETIGFITLSFEINPAFNRDVFECRIRTELMSIVHGNDAGWIYLELHFFDSELRLVVAEMERGVALLRMLYPVAVGVSIAIGAGLAVLLVLLNAKNAAIKRTLGGTKLKTQAVFCAEVLANCVIGLIIGIAALLLLGWEVTTTQIITLSALYFSTSLAGAATGAHLITRKSPLEMLQVRE
jgi:hypothetical protein